MADDMDIVGELGTLAQPSEIEKVGRFFKGSDPTNEVMGVPIGKVFPIAKKHVGLNLNAISALLDDPRYEVRMAAVAVLDFKARRKGLDAEGRKELFDLYVSKHDRINNWDLVDRAAPHVVGEYLVETDQKVPEELLRSDDPNRRRSAIVCTHAFLKRKRTGETFRVASTLAGDEDVYVQKAVASWVREAGKHDEAGLIGFLEQHATSLPRSTLTEASKRLSADIRKKLVDNRPG